MLVDAGVVTIVYKKSPGPADPPWRHAYLSFQGQAKRGVR